MKCSVCGGYVEWKGPLLNLTHTECSECGGINCQEPEVENVNCSGCGGEITPDLESPEQGVCGICHTYLEDLRNENAAREQRQIITREMAMDAGFPEMEGREW